MILDTISNAGLYAPVHPLFKQAFEFLALPDLKSQVPSRIDLRGSDLYAMISTQPGRQRSDALLEMHRKYIDIHFLLEGRESIGWKPTGDCGSVRQEYLPEKDMALFADEPVGWSVLEPGSFAVYFPGDAHAPLVGDGTIRKVVIKVVCL
jgi:biofilm protein TabA